MLNKMAASDTEGEQSWSVYILRCRGGSYYTGIAKNVSERLKKHKAGKGAAYTRIHPPEKILYGEDGIELPTREGNERFAAELKFWPASENLYNRRRAEASKSKAQKD